MDECVICLEALAPLAGGATRTLRCGHIFHRVCIDNALAVTAATCPLCRRVVPQIPVRAPAARARTTQAVDRHHLLQRLDRIDRLIARVADRLQQMPESLVHHVRLADTAREVREIRGLLGPRLAVADPATPATTRRTRETAPDRRPRTRSARPATMLRLKSLHHDTIGIRSLRQRHVVNRAVHEQRRSATSSQRSVPVRPTTPTSSRHSLAKMLQTTENGSSFVYSSADTPRMERAPTPTPAGNGGRKDRGVNGEDVRWDQLPTNAALDKLKTSREGLTSDEAQKRLAEYGPNKLPEEKVNKLMVFLSFLWNPLSWAMEVAAILAIVLLDYADFALIIFLLLLNAFIGYFEEIQAGDAVSALMGQLAPEAKALRNGEMVNVGADLLVPGDIIRVRLGDVIPADIKFLEGDPIKVDQSSLTGESLPVTKSEGDEGYSGSVVKQGEIEAVVTSTGVNTFLGRAAEKIATADSHGRLQQVLTTVGNFCMVSIIIWCVIELLVQMGGRSDENPCVLVTDGCLGVANILVLIVGGIPVAMPTVLSVTLAIGSSALAKENAIVTRLTCIEEMASMEVLCSDKTGTLTLNQLSVDMDNLIPYNNFAPEDIVKFGALAARIENNEAIDVVCYNTYPGKDTIKDEYTLLHYTPFDPTTKYTIAKLRDNKTGEVFRAVKGAPQVVLDMDVNADGLRKEVEERIDEFASRGYRGLGVGIDRSGDVPVEQCKWQLIGLMPLFDPPRHDTADTIKRAIELGIAVKMVTGDQRAIAVETCRQLGMPTNILDTSFFNQAPPPGLNLAQMIYDTDGFAQVFPEHKFEIVKLIQSLGKVVGMTGDGVNDAPALAQADIGIAVDDATDAARAAADIVLVSPGLSVIITAIRMSREIFLRMKNYAMYSIAMTVRIVFTFGLLTVAWNWYFPTLLVVILAILNDGTILTISKDNVKPSPMPDSWKLKEVFISSISFGLWLTLSTIVLFAVLYDSPGFSAAGVENLCVDCMQAHCDDFLRVQFQACAATYNASGCGEINGDVAKPGVDLARVGAFRARVVDQYWRAFDATFSRYDRAKLFEHLDGRVTTGLPRAPTPQDEYDQFVYQYTLGHSGQAFESANYSVFDASQRGEGVAFVGLDLVPLTNQVGPCTYLWGFSTFNASWSRGFRAMGPGVQRKQAVLRAIIYMQVSISGQALIFVTRTPRSWFFLDAPSPWLLSTFLGAQLVASTLGWLGLGGFPSARVAVVGCGGGYTLLVWLWAIVWHFPLDLIKFGTHYVVTRGAETYRKRAVSQRINAGHPTLTFAAVTPQQRSVRASQAHHGHRA